MSESTGTPGWGAAPPPMAPGTPWGGPPPAPRPGVVPLRPLGVGEILDGAITYIRRNPRATLGLAAAVALVEGALQVIVLALAISSTPSFTENAIDSTASSTTGTNVAINIVNIGQSVFALFLQLVATGMLTFVVSQAVLGRSVTAREAWARVRPLMWRLVGVALLTGLIVIGAVTVCVLPGILVLLAGSGAGGVVLLLVGVPLAVVAAIGLYVTLVLAPAVLVLERSRVVEALQRSRALVRGAFWRVLGISLLASIIANIIGSIIAVPFALLGGLGSFGLGTSGDTVFASALFGTTLGSAVGSVVTLPFVAGVTSLLYIDRRMRREGLDLALVRASGGAPAPTTVPPVDPMPGPQQW